MSKLKEETEIEGMNTKAAAKYCGVSVSSMKKMRADGVGPKLSPQKDLGVFIYTKTSCNIWLDGGENSYVETGA